MSLMPLYPINYGAIDTFWIRTASRYYYIDTISIFVMIPKFSPAVLSSILLLTNSIPSSAAAYADAGGITSSSTKDKKQNLEHWYVPFQTIDKLTRRLDLTKKQKKKKAIADAEAAAKEAEVYTEEAKDTENDIVGSFFDQLEMEEEEGIIAMTHHHNNSHDEKCTKKDTKIWKKDSGTDTLANNSDYCSQEYNEVGCEMDHGCLEKCWHEIYGYTVGCASCFADTHQCNALDQGCIDKMYECTGFPHVPKPKPEGKSGKGGSKGGKSGSKGGKSTKSSKSKSSKTSTPTISSVPSISPSISSIPTTETKTPTSIPSQSPTQSPTVSNMPTDATKNPTASPSSAVSEYFMLFDYSYSVTKLLIP